MSDAYHWHAEYNDGTYLDEYDESHPDGHGFADVDLSKLSRFILLPAREGLQAHVLQVTPPRRVIFFRRRTKTHDLSTNEQVLVSTKTFLGWQDTVNGRNVRAGTFYFDDGSSIVVDDPESIN